MKPGGILAFVLEQAESGDFKIMEQPACSELQFDDLVRRHLTFRPAFTVIPNGTLH